MTKTRMAAIVAVFAILLAACGSSDDSDAGSESADEVTSDFATTEPAMDAEVVDQAEASAEGDTDVVAGAAVDDAQRGEPSGSTADAAPSEPAADDEAAADDEETAEGELGAGGTAVTPTAADIGRKLIFTALVAVEVDDVAAASAEATSIIEGMGGFLFGQNTTGGAEPVSELTFKVLPADFNLALERLGTVGELRNQTVTTDDVTERIVDLESRISVAELGVERLRNELESTSSLEDFAELERLLLERESELEVMRGQLRTLQDRVDLATITLLVSQDRVENAIELAISTYEGHDGGQSCPGQDGVVAESGSAVTVCFDVVNVGDQTLTDIVLTDTVLDIDGETELIPVFGELDELAPGQSALVAYEFVPERSQQLRTRITAIPTDGVTSEPAGPSVSSQVTFDLRTFEPETDPGFGDGFSVALDFLKGLWVVLTVLIGFLIPMLIFVPFLWLAWRGIQEWRRRRPARPRPQPMAPQAPANQPPPPQPVGAAATPSAAPDGPAAETPSDE